MGGATFVASLAARVPLIAAQLATEAAALKTVARAAAPSGGHPWGMRAERIGSDWLTGLLHDRALLARDARVERLELEPFGEVGQMSILFRAKATYSGDASAPASLVVKTTAPEMKNRLFNAVFGVFETEIRTYRLPEPTNGLLRPKCWYTGQSPVTRAALLLLEDLEGWRSIPKLDKLTPDETRRVITAVAQHHARHWNDSTLRELGFRDSLQITRETLGPMIALAWRKAKNVIAPLVEPEILSLFARYVERQEALSRRLVAGPTTLLHGDLNTNNLFFDDAGDRVCAIDWQAARVGHWSEDLGYLLMMGMTDDALAEHEHALLEAYREELGRNGVALDAAQLDEEYGLGVLASAGILVVAAVIVDPAKDREVYDRYLRTISEWSRTATRRRVGELLDRLEA